MTDAMPRQDLKLPPPIGYISREEHAALIREAEAERDEAQRLMQMRHREMLAADELMRKHQGRAVAAEADRDRLAAANAALDAKVAGLVEALEPSAETKAAYMGEFYMGVTMSHPCLGEETRKVQIPWTTIKEVMAAIRARAALASGKPGEAGNG